MLLWACAEADSAGEAPFSVLGVVPEDGATDATEVQTPELHFSAPVDPDACDTTTVRLDAIKADGTVAFNIPIVLDDNRDGSRLSLSHGAGLVRGWTYAITVRGGDGGCRDQDGRVVVAFESTFVVP